MDKYRTDAEDCRSLPVSASTESLLRLASLPSSLVSSLVSPLVARLAPMLAPMLALCMTLAVTAGCEGVRELVQGLDEFEANEIMVVLEAKGIAADKVKLEGRVITYAIVVPEGDAKNALRILVANKLPKRRPTGLAEVYPAGSGGLIPTRSEEKAKFLMALQGEVERKLQRLPGIQSAHVTIVQPDKDIVRDLDTAPPPATASVAIVFNAYDDRGTSLISQDDVQRLVAASVEDLKPQNVAVVMKKNEPAKLVDIFADGGTVGAPVTSSTVFGVKVADDDSASRLKVRFSIFLFLIVLGLIVGGGGIARALSLQKKLQRAEAELASVRKATRGTQTGVVPAA
jgi:type III secretion protein J